MVKMYRDTLFRDPCAGFTVDRAEDVLRIRDDRLFSAGFEEVDNSLDLRSHGTLLEVHTFRHVLFGFIQRQTFLPAGVQAAAAVRFCPSYDQW